MLPRGQFRGFTAEDDIAPPGAMPAHFDRAPVAEWCARPQRFNDRFFSGEAGSETDRRSSAAGHAIPSLVRSEDTVRVLISEASEHVRDVPDANDVDAHAKLKPIST
jgi:hypothetical protein